MGTLYIRAPDSLCDRVADEAYRRHLSVNEFLLNLVSDRVGYSYEKPTRRRVTDFVAEQMVGLKNQGKSIGQIAEIFKVQDDTVREALKRENAKVC